MARGGGGGAAVTGAVGVTNTLAMALETSSSFMAVQSRLGHCLDYQYVNRYKLELVRQRRESEFGAFRNRDFGRDAGVIVAAKDNFDIHAKYAMSVAGKGAIGMSGTATQAFTRTRSRGGLYSSVSGES